MACWPAYITGSITLALLIFDLVVKEWNDLLPHAIGGVVITAILWGLCLISTTLSAAVLIVPSFALLIFLITIWITGQSLKRRGCCMKCEPEAAPAPTCGAPIKPTPKVEKKCFDNTLKAIQY